MTREDTLRQAKADALYAALTSPQFTTVLGVDADTSEGLRVLADLVEDKIDDADLWAGIARHAGCKPPGASYVEGRDPQWKKHATLRLLIDDLRAEADALDDDPELRTLALLDALTS